MVGLGFLFSLPHSFFESAECIGSEGQATDAEQLTAGLGDGREPAVAENDGAEGAAAGSSSSQLNWNESGATCIACGIGTTSQGFTSSAEQRQHFKTDWHRYNLKRRLDKKPPVTEQEFDAMIEQGDDVSSISGSDTESSEDEDSDSESAAAAGRRKGQAVAAIQGAQAVFKTADGAAFAVWRCLLLPDAHKHKQEDPSPQQLLQLLRQLRKAPDSSSSSNPAAAAAAAARGGSSSEQPADTSGCLWTLFMLRGGHFAAAVVKINSSSSSSSTAVPGSSQQQQQQQRPRVQQVGAAAEPFQVLAHKTFHRYVVRAKAGGKQSTKDATGKFARSAGSRLRRYNEAALQRDIAQLVKDWSAYLAASQLIFLAAPGSNSRVLFTAAADAQTLGGAGVQPLGCSASGQQQGSGVLDSANPRVRRVPFVTQRPTFSELKRVLLVLGSVRQAQIAAPEPEQQQQQQQQSPAKPSSSAAGAAAMPTAAVMSSHVSTSKKLEEPPLIKAAKAGDGDRAARLLSNGHDPSVRDSKGRSAYQLAANKEVRDAFRRFMAQNPDAWDYSSSDIPSPLTEEMENKKADKKARQKAKEKERKQGAAAGAAAGGSSSSSTKGAAAVDSFDDELAAAMAEAAAISSRSSGKSKQVGGPTSAAASKAAAAKAEEVAKRREQMAAAAEARLKALQQKQQLW